MRGAARDGDASWRPDGGRRDADAGDDADAEDGDDGSRPERELMPSRSSRWSRAGMGGC